MKHRDLLAVAVVVLFASAVVFAQNWSGILDPARAIDWSATGVPGGVPNRTTICSTLSPGATVSQINSALSSCPAGQVVLLSPGTYNTAGGTITIPSNVTLRGSGTSGPNMTQINLTNSGGAAVRFGNGSEPSPGTYTSITGGGTKGSSSITVASASGLTAGKLLVVTQSDLSYMTEAGDNGACTWCTGGIGGDSGQVVQVTAVSGNTITFNPPLYLDYTNSPQVFPYSVGCTGGGLENLRISANNTGYNPNILFDGAVNSWVKGVESDFADGAHLYLSYSLHNTVRDSFFHDGYSHGPGGTDDQVGLQYKSSANLIENNILYRQHVSVMLEWGASGNVIAYNYTTGNYDQDYLAWLINDFDFHGAHPMMNLFEGNIGDKFQPDSTWGSSSHSTLFRNYFTGSRQYVPPMNTRGALQPQNAQWESANTFSYSIDYLTTYTNAVGNLSGSAHLMSTGATDFLISPASGGSNPACWRIGYLAGTDAAYSPNNAYSTMFQHGMYDCTAGTFTWDPSHPSHTLPSSFYLVAKPSWFGSSPWPGIGPDVTGGTGPGGYVYKNPAQLCFENASKDANGYPLFDANACYGQGTTTPPMPPTGLTVQVK